MVRKVLNLAVGAALAATVATTMFVQAVEARVLHVHRYYRGHLIPASLRPGYVGAPGYPYGPPGPIVYSPVDFPPTGFFTPVGAVGYGTAVVTGTVGGVVTVITPTNGGFFPGLPVLSNIR